MRKQGMSLALGLAAVVTTGGVSRGAEMAEMMKDVKVSGYVDTTYTYNVNDPQSGSNAFRVFDTEANSFLLNNAALWLSKDAPAGGAGFGLVLNYGTDAEVTQALGSRAVTADHVVTVIDTNGDPAELNVDVKPAVDVQQGYVAYGFKGGNGWWRFGKMATMHGAEVIDGPVNLNISRSFLFGYAIPFTHTGLRVHYGAGEMLTGHLGVNNGWDNLKDDGKGKSAEAQVGVALPNFLNLSLAGMFGPEDNGSGTFDNRALVDVVATLTPTDMFTVVLNYDRGSQANVGGGTAPALWQGYAAYLNVPLMGKHSATLRGEIFDDNDGFRTGTVQTLKEVTLTVSCKQVENLEMRAEYRYDMSNQDVFQDNEGAAEDTQSTVGVQLIYSF